MHAKRRHAAHRPRPLRRRRVQRSGPGRQLRDRVGRHGDAAVDAQLRRRLVGDAVGARPLRRQGHDPLRSGAAAELPRDLPGPPRLGHHRVLGRRRRAGVHRAGHAIPERDGRAHRRDVRRAAGQRPGRLVPRVRRVRLHAVGLGLRPQLPLRARRRRAGDPFPLAGLERRSIGAARRGARSPRRLRHPAAAELPPGLQRAADVGRDGAAIASTAAPWRARR